MSVHLKLTQRCKSSIIQKKKDNLAEPIKRQKKTNRAPDTVVAGAIPVPRRSARDTAAREVPVRFIMASGRLQLCPYIQNPCRPCLPAANPFSGEPGAPAAWVLRLFPHPVSLCLYVSGSPGGGLLVAEAAAEEEGASQSPRLRTLSAGQPRSPDEHRRLLQRHGFQDVRVARAGDLLCVVLGTRAAP